MEVINAIWEIRNLGKTCQELNVNITDTIQDVLSALSKLTADYQIVRIPTARSDLLFELPKLGFVFIEMNIQLQRKMNERPTLPAIYKRFEQFIGYHKANEKEQEYGFEKIKSGDMFITDKVALDPCLGLKASGNRYAHWGKDVIDSGNCMYIATFKNENVGMCININKGDYYDGFLGGIYPEYTKMGLGFLPLFINLISAYDNGARLLKTGVSSNNLPIFRLHEVFNFETTQFSYIFVKHLK
jgi:hypothetical protein